MRRSILLVVLAACSSLAWPYGEEKIRGVNAGSWLVLEKWMGHAVFAGAPDTVEDEYKLTEYLGYSAAEQRMRNHWETWVTEADFAFWAKAGLNHVRLPIGYWALDIKAGEPWVSGSWEYVVKAAGWCKKYGLQLMIDIHAAPGSQNGWDHSGSSGAINFFTDENINRTINVIGQIARFSNLSEWRETVTAIGLLNEPTLWDDFDYRLTRLKEFYDLGYQEVRKYNHDAVVVVHDAFVDLSTWYYLGSSPYSRVILDAHLYQVFDDSYYPKLSCTQHHQHPCTYHERLSAANERIWTIVGEWSLATPTSCDGKDFFARQQIAAFEKASGWIMWAFYNAEGMWEWSFRHAYENSWINPAGNNTAHC